MTPLREQLGATDPVVAQAARMFASVDAAAPSEQEMARVWAGMRSRRRAMERPLWLRVAVVAMVLFGLVAVAGATVGRRWVERVLLQRSNSVGEVVPARMSRPRPPAVNSAPQPISAIAPPAVQASGDGGAVRDQAATPPPASRSRPDPVSPRQRSIDSQPAAPAMQERETSDPPPRDTRPAVAAPPSPTTALDDEGFSEEFGPDKPGAKRKRSLPNEAPILPAR